MPNCKNCGAEVDLDQRTCAWCGVENPAGGGGPLPKRPEPPKPVPPVPTAPTPSHTGSEMKVHKGKGPSVEDARNLAQRGDMTGALSLFNRILEAQPNNEEALFGTGGVFFKQGEPKKAIEHWLKLKVLNPLYPNLDNWIQQAKQKLPPPTAPRKHPATSPSQLGIGSEEDWQHQPVRLSEKDQQKAFASASSHLIEPPETKPEVERILQVDDGIVRSKAWVIPLGWALLVVYIGLIWLLYFSSVFSG